MSTGKKPQRPVYIQFATYLRLYGAANQNHITVALDCNIGTGSVIDYSKRVAYALRDLRSRYVQWPRGLKRESIKYGFGKKGFPGAIGAADGSLMRLVECPGILYYCRKKFYAVHNDFHLIETHLADLLPRHVRSTYLSSLMTSASSPSGTWGGLETKPTSRYSGPVKSGPNVISFLPRVSFF